MVLASEARAGTRHAVVIANNAGFADEPMLHFAESDADLIVRTLRELGVTSPATTHRIPKGTVAELRESLEHLLRHRSLGGDKYSGASIMAGMNFFPFSF